MFIDRLNERIRELSTPLCVGLDPMIESMPEEFRRSHGVTQTPSVTVCAELLYAYCERVLSAVEDLVPVVKPQSAYFERYGADGIRALERVVASARTRGLLVLLDAKRGDIGSTSEAYAQAYLSDEPPRELIADAMTVSPYLGPDSLEPFFATAMRYGKGVFACARTSNPGGAVIQDRQMDGKYIYELVAELIQPWSERSLGRSGYSGIGLVVGATVEEPARRLRAQLPRSLFLVPGLGAQKGTLAAVRACFNADGLGAIISVSRSVMYPHLFGDNSENGQAIRSSVIAIRDTLRREIPIS